MRWAAGVDVGVGSVGLGSKLVQVLVFTELGTIWIFQVFGLYVQIWVAATGVQLFGFLYLLQSGFASFAKGSRGDQGRLGLCCS